MRGIAALSLCASLLLSACGSEADDRAEIQETVHAYFDALAAGEIEELVGYITSECDIDIEVVREEFQKEYGGVDIEANIEEVEILSLEEDAAEVRVTGTLSSEGLEIPINPTGESITPMVEEDGEWRFSSCNLGGPG